MQARDGPENSPVSLVTPGPSTPLTVTRNKKTAKSSELMGKPTQKRTRMPAQKRGKKPPSVTGYHWRREGVGWDLRKDIYVTGNDGVRKRKQPFVAHLSKSAFGELKRRHKGASLEKAIARWVEDHDK